jgi:NADP-dependent 3-hydroxy acid dehydrogenase YdfG
MPIAGKVVAITGASSGIGEATARVLAERGSRVVLGARRGERLDRLAKDIRQRGGVAVTHVTDVTRREDLVGLVGRASAEFGRLDVLVSNAGVAKIGPMSDAVLRQDVRRSMDEFGLAPEAVAEAVAYAIDQPPEVEIGDITIRPTVQS